MFSFIYLIIVIFVSFISRQKRFSLTYANQVLSSLFYLFLENQKILILAKKKKKPESSLIEAEIVISPLSVNFTYIVGLKMKVYAGRSLDRNICKYHCLLSFLLTTANTDWVTITRAQPRLWADDQKGDISNSCPPLVSKH